MKKHFLSVKRITSLALAVLLLSFAVAVPVMAALASQIVSGQTYIIRNKGTGKYFTLPLYTECSKNVFQSGRTINDEYSFAVRVLYDADTDRYRIVPLIYENFGDWSVSENNDNVILASGESYEWKIETGILNQEFKISDGNGRYMTAIGNGSGNSKQKNCDTGNIWLASNSGSENQVWTFEAVTVNPHNFKADEITKKNIGAGREWLFKLSGGEMYNDNYNITETDVSSCRVRLVRNGKWIIIKMKEDFITPDDRSDDYAIVDITINNQQIRTVVVQNSGTGNSDACRTLPFGSTATQQFNYGDLSTVTIRENTINEYMLTFRSTLGNVNVISWEIEDECNCVEFSKHYGKNMIGNNFALVTLKNIGFAVVKARESNGNLHIMTIEVKNLDENGNTKTSPYVKDVSSVSYNYELQLFRNYLFKVDSSCEVVAAEWQVNQTDYQQGVLVPGFVVAENNNYVVFKYDQNVDGKLSAFTSNFETFDIFYTHAKAAIIIVPGIMGSKLWAGSDVKFAEDIFKTFSTGDLLWAPSMGDVLYATKMVRALTMYDNGQSVFDVYVNDPLVNQYNYHEDGYEYGTQDMYRKVYNELYLQYRAYGYDVILYEYDWRYHPYDTATLIDGYIQSNDYKDVIFVGHSMGGNVVSYYLAMGENQRNRVSNNISIGTPYLGAPQILYVMLTGRCVSQGFNIDALLQQIGFCQAIKDTMVNLPSTYELLPSEIIFAEYIRILRNDVYTELDATQTGAFLNNNIPNWNSQLYAYAKNKQNLLFDDYYGHIHITNKVQSYHLVGLSNPTISSITFTNNNGSYSYNGYNNGETAFGDSTVTIYSATVCNSLRSNRVYYKYENSNFSSDHVEMIKGEDDPTTIHFITAIICKDGNVLYASTNDMFNNYGIKPCVDENEVPVL